MNLDSRRRPRSSPCNDSTTGSALQAQPSTSTSSAHTDTSTSDPDPSMARIVTQGSDFEDSSDDDSGSDHDELDVTVADLVGDWCE